MAIPLTDEQLALVRTFAGLFFNPQEVAMMIGLNPEHVAKACRMRTFDAALHDAYHGGLLEAEMVLRKVNMDFAKKGSSPAMREAFAQLSETKSKIQMR